MADRRSFASIAAQTEHPVNAPLVSRRLRSLALALRGDWLLLMLVPLLLIVGLWHLDRYPRTWFDEGMYLQVAKNFAHDRLYAVRSADGTIDYAPIIGVGPTVLMPAALAVAVGGDELSAARVVPFIAFLLATVLLYLLARGLFGRLAAACTLLLLLTLPALDWLATGRQLLGEVPAILLLLCGGLCAWFTPSRRAPVIAGLFFGLTLMTKGQYLLVLPPALCLIALFDLVFTKQRPWRWYLWLIGVTGMTYVVWMVALLSFLNEGQLVENYRQLRASSGGALLVFNRERMVAGVKFLLGPRTFFLVLPATVAGLWLTWRATGRRRLALAALWGFQSLWFLWFAFASIAWPRYAFPGLVLSTIFMGVFLARALELAVGAVRQRRWRVANLAAIVIVGLLALLIGRGAWSAFSPVALADQREPQQFAHEVDRLVPTAAVIDSWEPELGFLTNRSIQHPPLGTLDRVVRARWLPTGSGPTASLDMSAGLKGDYLIVGPFARWVGIYTAATTSSRYRLVAQVGEYELYQRIGGTASEKVGSTLP